MDDVLWGGVDVLSTGQDITSLRKMVLVSVMRRHFQTGDSIVGLDSLATLLAKLPSHDLSTVADIAKGKTGIKDAKPGPYPLVVTAEARSECDHFDYDGPAVLIPMVSSTGHGDASLKRIHYQEGKYAVGTILAVVRPLNPSQLSARYLYEYLSAFKEELLVSRMVGTANVSLTVKKLGDVPVPLIPIESQRQIERLMALCDRLEADQADAEAAHAQLVQALLDSLTQATDAADFRASWQRLSEHFHTLFTTEASIDALKQAVLQLAVTGKLTKQSDSVENARTTYERMIPLPHGYRRQGKQKITGASLIDTQLLPILPPSWCYLTVDDLYAANHIAEYADGNHGSDYPSKAEFGREGVLFLTAAQISDIGQIDWENCPRLKRDKAAQLTKGWATAGDVLVTHNATVGRTAIVEECPDSECLLGTSVTLYRMNANTISNRYLYIYFSSLSWYSQMTAVMQQTTRNQVSITKQALFYIALPPRSEQDLIADVVDALMALCDQLKARLAESRQQHAQLATVLVEQAVAA